MSSGMLSSSGNSVIARVPLRMESWEIDNNDLDIEGCIGMGSNHVRVYRGLWKEVLEVAIKEIPKTGSANDRLTDEIVKEVTVLIHMRHPNVLHFYGMTEDAHSYKLVMEFCERGSLMDLLRKANATPNLKAQLHWHRRLEIAQNIAAGMAFLHAHNVLHRDLKSPNVLLTQKLDVKVADFGFSRFCDNIEQYTTSSTPMNLRWLAPEILEDSDTGKTSWTPAADIFSYGVILWELLTFKFPFADMDNMKLMIKANQGTLELPIPSLDEIPGGYFPNVNDYITLTKDCLNKRPAGRPKNFLSIVHKLRAMVADSFPRGRPTTPSSPVRSSAPPPAAFAPPNSRDTRASDTTQTASTATYNTSSSTSPAVSQVMSAEPLCELPSFDPTSVPPSSMLPSSYVESSPSPFGALDSQPSEFDIHPSTAPVDHDKAAAGGGGGGGAFAGFTSAVSKLASKFAESTPFGRSTSPSPSSSAAVPARAPLQPIQGTQPAVRSAPTSGPPSRMGSQVSPFSAFEQGPVFDGNDFPSSGSPFETPQPTASPRRSAERTASISFRDYKANMSNSPTAASAQPPAAQAGRPGVVANRSAPAGFPVAAATPAAALNQYASMQVNSRPPAQDFQLMAGSVPSDVHQPYTYKDSVKKFLWWFNEIDCDGNGKIDAEELSKSLPDDFGTSASEKNAVLMELIEQFQEVDQNHDGVIDRGEFLAAAGKLLQKNLRKKGRSFDLKMYENECKLVLNSMPKSRVMSVDCFDAAVYKALVDDYIRWFREFDSDANDSISVVEIQDYLRKNNHNPAIPKDQLSILSTLYRRFKEFDSNSDGVIDKHEYLHMCARLLTEEHIRQGFAVDETRCRYHLYFYALNLNNITLYKDVPRNAARAVDIRADDQDLQLQLLCDESAKDVLGRMPRKYDTLDNTQFRRILSKLCQMMKARGLPK